MNNTTKKILAVGVLALAGGMGSWALACGPEHNAASGSYRNSAGTETNGAADSANGADPGAALGHRQHQRAERQGKRAWKQDDHRVRQDKRDGQAVVTNQAVATDKDKDKDKDKDDRDIGTTVTTGSDDVIANKDKDKDETDDTTAIADTDKGNIAADAGSGATDGALDSFRAEFLGLINAWRASNGKGALIYEAAMDRAATDHSAWMQSTGAFSHTGENGSRFYQRCQAAGTTCDAENIAWGFTSAQQLFELWKNSPGHNANMLGDHTVMGLGLVGKYATNDFR